ncbi:conserved hypothetical protein [Ricinus communis]|uniref:Uncharacterized protein n=1 Tax=Ricinus communis TaxID=3988 RepID=B9RVH0_RICCO|nr:conserved hypothetical protein [Ricinus communis]
MKALQLIEILLEANQVDELFSQGWCLYSSCLSSLRRGEDQGSKKRNEGHLPSLSHPCPSERGHFPIEGAGEDIVKDRSGNRDPSIEETGGGTELTHKV